MCSFLGDVIKNMTEREEALGESTKFAARWDLVVPDRTTGGNDEHQLGAFDLGT